MSRPASSRILRDDPPPQLAGSVEDPGRLAPAGRYSHSENLYGALGPNGVLFQGSTELLGGCDDLQREFVTGNNPIGGTIFGLEPRRMMDRRESRIPHP